MSASLTRISYAVQWSEAEPKPSNISARINNIPSYVHAGDDLMIQVDGDLHPCQVVDLENTYNP